MGQDAPQARQGAGRPFGPPSGHLCDRLYVFRETNSARRGLQIDNSDKIGFYEVTHAIKGKSLDLMIHSPGGSPEAAEAIVESLRSRFSHVRVIVPSYAKSAATMMAMSANEILLEQDAELGPIDPQMITANGYSPAEAIKEQFIKAAGEIASDPRKLSVWIPILQQMGPSLLVQCDNAIALSKTLVKQWLTRFMFEGECRRIARSASPRAPLSQSARACCGVQARGGVAEPSGRSASLTHLERLVHVREIAARRPLPGGVARQPPVECRYNLVQRSSADPTAARPS